MHSTFSSEKKIIFITTGACITGLGAILSQRKGKTFSRVAFARRFLTDCEKKYAVNELELLGLEYLRYYVTTYTGKK